MAWLFIFAFAESIAIHIPVMKPLRILLHLEVGSCSWHTLPTPSFPLTSLCRIPWCVVCPFGQWAHVHLLLILSNMEGCGEPSVCFYSHPVTLNLHPLVCSAWIFDICVLNSGPYPHLLNREVWEAMVGKAWVWALRKHRANKTQSCLALRAML